MRTVLVTGAAGFIGSHTCEALLTNGDRVIGVDDFSTGKLENLQGAKKHAAFRFVEGDVSEAGSLERIAADAKPEAIVHLAALVSVPQSIADPDRNFRLNVVATQRVLETARRHSVQRVVFASSAAVYGEETEMPLRETSATHPISPYGAAKLASEALLLGQGATFGITVRCLRYFNVYGPRQDPKSPYSGVISIFCEKLQSGAAPTIFGDGQQTRDFISVHDVARANVIAACSPGLTSGVTNICTGKATSLSELATILRKHAPSAPRPVHAAAREGDIRHSFGSPDRAKVELGFSPEVPLEQGLAELIAKTKG